MRTKEDRLLSVDGLTITYRTPDGVHPAVTDVTFDVSRSERVAIVGESGSGKSSLCLAVGGFLNELNTTITHRAMRFAGEPIDRSAIARTPRRTDGMSMVFQDAMTSLDPVWRIGSQLGNVIRTQARRNGQDLSRGDVTEHCHMWLGRVGLRDSTRVMRARPYEISGGMRQRAMLAIALCSEPSLLIADEPTSALDASLSRDVMDLMVELTHSSETALLLVTHDIQLCLAYTERVIVMSAGRIVDDVGCRAIDSDARSSYTHDLLACVPTLDNVDDEELRTIAGLERNALLGREAAAS